ncbi:Mitochondrial pyruvate carrier 1 [Penicillium lividum]|nr:Mitochondrial pyruvate carrier 1 [Penicillium lividum]
MAAAIKAINAKIRSNKVADYVCSTRTLLPASEFPAVLPGPRSASYDTVSWKPEIKKSTDFWGPVSNFGIPFAAVMDTQKDPDIISGTMTGALLVYAATFMRYSLAITPKNYLLFACHLTNFGAQTTQGYRYLAYWNWGGREAKLAEQAKQGKAVAEGGSA